MCVCVCVCMCVYRGGDTSDLRFLRFISPHSSLRTMAWESRVRARVHAFNILNGNEDGGWTDVNIKWLNDSGEYFGIINSKGDLGLKQSSVSEFLLVYRYLFAC